MANLFDFDPRGPSNRRLFIIGVCFMLVATVIVVAAIAKSKGKLTNLVPVSAELVDVGDGLPARSDVKFRGVLVGSVSDVVAARLGRPNLVHIDLKPEFVAGIPNTVTARVVPSNVFAVSSVQLIDNGKASPPLRAGAVIFQDSGLPTLVLQSALNKARELFSAAAREPTGDSVGALTALGEATEGRGRKLTEAGHGLNDIVTQLDSVVGGPSGSSTISALIAAADGLRGAAPELFDALRSAVKPMRTFAEKRAELTTFLSGGLNTVGTLDAAFDHQTDRLIAITTELAPVIGVLADHAGDLKTIFTRLQRVANQFYEAWDPRTKIFVVRGIISFTPTRTYVRADCPRYGELIGPSCQTAPEVPTAPALLPALGSHGAQPPPGLTENRPNLASPRDSLRGAPQAPAAPPAVPPFAQMPAPPPAGGPPPPSEPSAAGGAAPQSAVIGGNVGPVGSRQEKDQLSRIIGGEANAATQLLLGPLARGATVHIAPDGGGDR